MRIKNSVTYSNAIGNTLPTTIQFSIQQTIFPIGCKRHAIFKRLESDFDPNYFKFDAGFISFHQHRNDRSGDDR